MFNKQFPIVFVIAAILLLPGYGCVRRRMTIRSNPPGAVVYIDDQEIGKTPVSTYFTYYGTRKIRLVRDGYETLTVMQKVAPPWYQIAPLDFVSENLYPGELRDERLVEFDLQPQRIVPRDELLNRANELRTASHAEAQFDEPRMRRLPSADIGPGPTSEFNPAGNSIPPPFYPDEE